MFIQVTSLFLFIMIIIIIIIDVVPIFKDWIGRIHIGRYDDKNIWNESITKRGLHWLNHTPKIRVTDNTRLIIVDMLRGNYTKGAIQQWQEASLLLGLEEYLKYTDDLDVKESIDDYLRKKFDNRGQWKEKPNHVEGAILAYAIMKLDHIKVEEYKKSMDYVWEMIKNQIGKDGTVEYRKEMTDYRYVDTIGFICPFLVTYGIKFSNEYCIDLAIKQIKEYEKFGMLNKHSAPYHAYNIKDMTPLGIYGWGRGFGWYAIGLIDAWNELPENHKYKNVLRESVKMFAKTAIALQQVNGSWNWTVTRKESRPDSSTTATLGWFILNAAKINEISHECLRSAETAINYLIKITRRNGEVDFSQGDTKDIGVYSMLFNKLPFTQGFCIRLINYYKKWIED